MAYRSSGRLGLFSAEVPCGPIQTCLVTIEAVAVPLHPNNATPVIPTVVIPNTRARPIPIEDRCADSQWG